jgi:hypothetical protein
VIGRRARFYVRCAVGSVGVDRLKPVMLVVVFVRGWTVLVLGVFAIRTRMHVLGQFLPPGGDQDRDEQAREPPLHGGSLWDGSGAVNDARS